MATQKPISTISYNTEAFLLEKLNAWYNAHIIQAYMFICHKGEDGDKDHIHLRIEPNKKLDPMNLQAELQEYTRYSDKPLGCRPFRPSKEEDWFLYVVHDKDYLNWKYGGGEKGEKLSYDWHDISVSPMYDLEIAWIRAKGYMQHSSVNLASRLRNGESAFSLLMQGENVFVLNALNRALSATDYQTLSLDLQEANEELKAILEAINAYGLILVKSDDGKYLLCENEEDN